MRRKTVKGLCAVFCALTTTAALLGIPMVLLHWNYSGVWRKFLGAGISCAVVALVLLVLLLLAAGRRPGQEAVVLNRLDCIPYDLFLLVAVFLLVCGGGLLINCAYLFFSLWYDPDELVWYGVSTLLMVVLFMALLLTTVTRLKAHTLLHNTVIAWCGRKCIAFFRALPLIWRVVLLFLGYLAGEFFLLLLWAWGLFDIFDDWMAVFAALLMLAYQVGALYLLCRWALQWKTMRRVTGQIIAGEVDAQIDHQDFYPDLKEHATQLNALGRAIDQAVEERLKSDRFKAELITNVSHDLKTPLTSIINYVDLLKKEELDNPTAQECIQVLDRKSQRLKKLTEDLIEASKASTGAVAVSRERLDLAQLARQAAGEYEARLKDVGLSFVVNVPEGELPVSADGKHLWRVLDNLLNNCVKYALEGTRVYVDAAKIGERAVLTVKNISRQPLNVPPEQLMERFVRGDESRTTEGSGLGLSIARSLTELQEGRFSLSIDGDLFKAIVEFSFLDD